MVKASIVFSAAPLLSVAFSLYLPHDYDSTNNEVATHYLSTDGVRNHHGYSTERSINIKGTPQKQSWDNHFQPFDESLQANRNGQVVPSSSSSSFPDLKGLIVSHANPEDIIPDHYIVVFRKEAAKNVMESTLQLLEKYSAVTMQQLMSTNTDHKLLQSEKGFQINHLHTIEGTEHTLRGFSGHFFPEVVQQLATHPDILFIEHDSVVHINEPKEENGAPWGLARVSHRDILGLSTYNKYLYDGDAGEGVTSYVVDTGIYTDHEDFEGRAVWGKTMPLGDPDIDSHGHGSHCAGTIGGKKYGIAKKAQLVAVKVLGSDGSGSMSDVIGGIEYVVESHQKEKLSKGSKFKGSTANMSLGGGKSPSLDLAVNAATQAGVHFAVAAGNDNQDACNVSPAGAEGAVTVGATDLRDQRAYFSNYGKCVDIFAPGVNVLSVGTISPSSSAIMSGTSMASPHVAGLLTYFLSLQPTSDSEYSVRDVMTTKELKKHLIEFGTNGKISNLDFESPNILAFNGAGEDLSDFWVGTGQGHNDEIEDNSKASTSPAFLENVKNSFDSMIKYVREMWNYSQGLTAHV